MRDGSKSERLQRALIELCYERHLENVSIVELCGRAQVGEDFFHANYADLEDCFCVVYEALAEEFLPRMAAAFQNEERWQDQLRAVAYAFLHYLQEDPPRAHFTAVESLVAGDRAQVIRDSVFGGMFVLIDQGRFQGGDPDRLTPATAEALGGSVFRHIRLEIEGGTLASADGLVPKLMHTIVLTYLGPEAAAEELRTPPPS